MTDEDPTNDDGTVEDGTVSETYEVEGMTCGHCVSAVTEELMNIETVTEVEVELETGRVTVTSTESLDADAVREAIDEAGYELVS